MKHITVTKLNNMRGVTGGITLEKAGLPVGTINKYGEKKMPDGSWKYIPKGQRGGDEKPKSAPKPKETISKEEWDKLPKNYKMEKDGVKYMLKMTDAGTSLVPVSISKEESKKEGKDPVTHGPVSDVTSIVSPRKQAVIKNIQGMIEKERVLATVSGVEMGEKELKKHISNLSAARGKAASQGQETLVDSYSNEIAKYNRLLNKNKKKSAQELRKLEHGGHRYSKGPSEGTNDTLNLDTTDKVKKHIEGKLGSKVSKIEQIEKGKRYPHNNSNPYSHDTYKVSLENGQTFQLERKYGRPRWSGNVSYSEFISIN